ncbi:MAG TPA: hypothetical protein VHG91_18835 [Longimicrobium sp.]|nr:hypothetical protein [Longimicrobium sp.]
MHALVRPFRPLALGAALLVLAACDGGGGGTGSDRLTSAETQGVYQVCALRFVPTQQLLPAADLLQRVIQTAPPQGKPTPTLTLSGNAPQFELVYTRRSDNFLQQYRGTLGYTENAVTVGFGSSTGTIARELLLPGSVTLAFTATPRRLSTTGSAVYSVSRADYARASGASEENLAERINGRLVASFSVGACP